MKSLFSHASITPLAGTPAYLESVQRVFVQDHNSGMIWLEMPGDRQACLLYLGGEPAGIYALDPESARRLDQGQLAELLAAGEAQISSLELSMLGVRLAQLRLEAGPLVEEWQIAARDLPGVFERCKVEKTDGLLVVDLPQIGAYSMLRGGETLSTESLLSTYEGIQSGLLNSRHWLERPEATCSLALYRPDWESPAWQSFALRQAMTGWVHLALARYQQLVGANLLNTLDFELNMALRMKRINLHLVGAALIDQHLFLQPAAACQAYHFLASSLVQQITRVIGKGLAVRTLDEMFRKLPDGDRQTLEMQDLLPGRLEV